MVADQDAQIHSRRIHIAYAGDHIPRTHACLICRRILEHPDHRDDPCIHILAHLDADAAVFAVAAFLDTLIFLCRIVSRIGVLKGIYIARIDPVLRVFPLLVLIEQIILVNELLHIAQLWSQPSHIQAVFSLRLRKDRLAGLLGLPAHDPDSGCHSHRRQHHEGCYQGTG